MNLSFPSFTIFLSTIGVSEMANLLKADLESAFESQVNLTANDTMIDPKRYLKSGILDYRGFLYQQKDKFLVYSDNTGESYSSLVASICRKNSLSAAHCRIHDEKPYPGYFLTFYGEDQTRRVLQCYNDGGPWVFYETGPVQPFEDTLNYQNRIKRKRFNGEIIASYLMKLGMDIKDPKFWQPVELVWELERV